MAGILIIMDREGYSRYDFLDKVKVFGFYFKMNSFGDFKLERDVIGLF